LGKKFSPSPEICQRSHGENCLKSWASISYLSVPARRHTILHPIHINLSYPSFSFCLKIIFTSIAVKESYDVRNQINNLCRQTSFMFVKIENRCFVICFRRIYSYSILSVTYSSCTFCVLDNLWKKFTIVRNTSQLY
jgi:hypothetical protein